MVILQLPRSILGTWDEMHIQADSKGSFPRQRREVCSTRKLFTSVPGIQLNCLNKSTEIWTRKFLLGNSTDVPEGKSSVAESIIFGVGVFLEESGEQFQTSAKP